MVPLLQRRPFPLAVVLVGLLAATALAGCIGGKGTGEKDAGAGDPLIIEPQVPVETPDKTERDTTDLFTPKAHFHHYWGDPPVPMVVIFDGQGLEFEQFPMDKWQEEHNWPVGFLEFNLETDGDDVSSGEGDNPVNPATKRADAVFAGTSHLIVNISWVNNDLTKTGDLRLKYKPACSPLYQPADNAGIPIVQESSEGGTTRAKPIRIPVRPECADPPHQIAVSRWAFLVVASQSQDGNVLSNVMQNPPSFARGKVNVRIEAQNGGERAIGPPHPDLFDGNATLQLGPAIEGSFALKQGGFVPPQDVREPGSGNAVAKRQCQVLDGHGFDDIRLPTRFIVPFQTQELRVDLTLAYDASMVDGLPEANAGQVRLIYHPANHTNYALATGQSGDGAAQTYTFVLRYPEDAAMTDPVYNVDSDWRFGFRLFTNDQECLGYWGGTYSMTITATRNPDIRIF